MLQENPKLIKEGTQREISQFVSDPKKKKKNSPRASPFGDDVKGLHSIMNGYMDAITNPILDADGMVIKYIGDASTHVHNAIADDPEHSNSSSRQDC